MRSPLIALLVLPLLALPFASRADDDDDEHEEREHHRSEARTASKPPPPPNDPSAKLYRKECASCHMAYPPGLLPARSWKKLLGGLDDHFGQNAELDAASRATLEAFLTANAAESGSLRKSGKLMRGLGDATPLRPSELPYVVREHDEIRPDVFKRKSIVSRANCLACHPGAEGGSFSEHEVQIPR